MSLGIISVYHSLVFYRGVLEPVFPITNGLVDDWFTFTNFLVLFFYGFLLMTLKTVFWQTVETYRRLFLIGGIVGFSSILGIWFLLNDSPIMHFIEAFVKVFNLWSWILAIFGYTARYVNRNSNLLKYCNTAVYPFYILHQTITIAIGYYIIDLDWEIGRAS